MNQATGLSNLRTQLRKGFLDLCVLNCLNAREYYGYDIVQTLKQSEGAAIREGIVYPILARMQEEGFVTSETRPSSSGPPRKYYRITPMGRDALGEMNEIWRQMVATMELAKNMKKEKVDV
jgi:PadR family transcriptional regulator PadR